jgi:hypothetical protein
MHIDVDATKFSGVIAMQSLTTLGEVDKVRLTSHEAPRELRINTARSLVQGLKSKTLAKLRRSSVQSPVQRHVPEVVRFATLASEWKRETAVLPSAIEAARHPAYLRIIAMGERAVPLILAQLKLENDMPDHWFLALAFLTNENPVPDDARGNLKKMRDAWLHWGLANGYGA